MKWVMIALVAACGRVDFDPITDGGDDGIGVTCPVTSTCPLGSLGAGQGGFVSANQRPVNNGFSGSCGGVANPEASWRFDPLQDGPYTIAVPTGLSLVVVRDGCCTGAELACAPSGVTITRKAGQTAVIFVESLSPTVTITVTGS